MRSAVAFAVAVAAAGCSLEKMPNDPGVVCTAIAVSALNVTVRDAGSGAPLCDATVTAIDGSGLLYALRQTGDCRYAGAEERAGQFEVFAARPGYETTSVRGIRVGRDECHVIPVQLTVDVPRRP